MARFSFSYSRWSVWKECPQKYKFKHVVGLKDEPSPAMLRGRKVHDSIAKFVDGTESQIPAALEQFTILAEGLREWPEAQKVVEDQMAFDRDKKRVKWFGPNAYYRMIWDVAVWDSEKTTLNCVDFKTGSPRGSYDDQMQLFALPAYWTMPALESFTAHLVYVDTGDVVSVSYDRDAMYGTGGGVGLDDIWRGNAARMEADTEFPPTPSHDACRFCPFHQKRGGPCTVGV